MKNKYCSVRGHAHAHACIFQIVVILGMLQCFLPCNNLNVYGFTTTSTIPCKFKCKPFPSSPLLKEGQHETKLYAGNSRENEIRKKVGTGMIYEYGGASIGTKKD